MLPVFESQMIGVSRTDCIAVQKLVRYEAEITEARYAMFINKNVSGFYVAVYHSACVQGAQPE